MRRTLSLVLVLVLMLTMVPAAFAAEDQLPVDTGSAGSGKNPIVLEKLGWVDTVLTIKETTCNYTYTAQADGTITFAIARISNGNDGDIIVTNKTTGVTRRLSRDGVNSYGVSLTMDVAEDDVLLIQVIASAATNISWTADFSAAMGGEENPIYPTWDWNDAYNEATVTVTVPVGTTYYAVNRPGMLLTVNEEEYGILTPADPQGETAVFAITNDGKAAAEYQLKISWPAGAIANPDVLEMGAQTANVAAGSQGYYYTWTAEESGTLVLQMPAGGNWRYEIQNLTTGAGSKEQLSDSKPVVNPADMEVSAGDVLQIKVNTYDPKNPETAPAGSVKFSVSFREKAEEGSVMMGDVNGDGRILANDAMLTLQYSVGVKVAGNVILEACDVSGDGRILANDAMMILQYSVGFLKEFPNK